MTFHPSEKRQKEWVDKHLNSGVCPGRKDYYKSCENAACYSALEWLSEQDDIHTLADAWDLCKQPEWLGWMYARMEPNQKDLRLWSGIVEWLVKKISKEEGWNPGILEEYLPSWQEEYKPEIARILKQSPINKEQLASMIEDCAQWIDWLALEGKGWPMDEESLQWKLCQMIRKKIPNPWISKSQRK